MKRLRYLVLILVAAAVFVRSGQGCAFSDDDTPSFNDPDRPYSAFLEGKLGVISGQLRVRHLVAAYNILSGRGLTPGEKKAAVDVDQFYNYNGGVGPETTSPNQLTEYDQKTRSALQVWMDAAPGTATRSDHSVPGEDYSTFANCLDDAYVHAANTLVELRKRYGKPVAAGGAASAGDTPEIKEWIAGQDAVFSNCSDQKPAPDFSPGGSGKPGPEPVATMPQAAAASAPLWLRQARAYQIAAADFYAVRYDQALAEFNAIAADKASPYGALSRYVAARTLIRRATVFYKANQSGPKKQGSDADTRQRLGEGRDALRGIVRDPAMAQYHASAQHLLDYVMVRLDPAGQAEELARRLTAPAAPASQTAIDMAYRQNVIDLTYAFNSLPLYSASPVGPKNPGPQIKPSAPLLRWINDLQTPPAPDMGSTVAYDFLHTPAFQLADSFGQWQSTKQPQWLAAYLVDAAPGAPGLAAGFAAAGATPQASPAWATVSYHRLRLERTSASYTEIASLMPVVEKTQPRSTINLFADLESGTAPSLDLFLKAATRITPQSIQTEPNEGFQQQGPENASQRNNSVTLCNVPIANPDTLHLDAETAVIFNQRMPVRLLRDGALLPDLPGNVRFAVAHMAWTRAVLLDQPAIARALSPYLRQCQPAFQQWLDAYDQASTAEARHLAGLMALMRFTSTEPEVRPGMERDFAAYDETRDNWWCDANVPYEGSTAPNPQAKPMVFSQPLVARGNPPDAEPDPPFLSSTDKAEADRELAQLNKIGDAGDYFAREALAWVKAHPADPQNADLLGFAMRVVRNACRSSATKELNHQLFDTLHMKYPKSEWAIRYKTWE